MQCTMFYIENQVCSLKFGVTVLSYRDFPPLRLISLARISKVYIVLKYWNMSDFPLLKNQQLIIL